MKQQKNKTQPGNTLFGLRFQINVHNIVFNLFPFPHRMLAASVHRHYFIGLGVDHFKHARRWHPLKVLLSTLQCLQVAAAAVSMASSSQVIVRIRIITLQGSKCSRISFQRT